MSSCCPALKTFLHPFAYVDRNGSSKAIPKKEQRNIIIAAIAATIFALPVLYVLAAWRRRHYCNVTNPNPSSTKKWPTATKTQSRSPSTLKTSRTKASRTSIENGADFLTSVTPDNITTELDVGTIYFDGGDSPDDSSQRGTHDFLFVIDRVSEGTGKKHYEANLFDPRELSWTGVGFWIEDGKFACYRPMTRVIHQFNTLKDYIDWLCKGDFWQGESTRVKGNYVFKKRDGSYIRYRNPFVTQ